eukprot:gene4707-42203_t
MRPAAVLPVVVPLMAAPAGAGAAPPVAFPHPHTHQVVV